jgi:hypothetical protein
MRVVEQWASGVVVGKRVSWRPIEAMMSTIILPTPAKKIHKENMLLLVPLL